MIVYFALTPLHKRLEKINNWLVQSDEKFRISCQQQEAQVNGKDCYITELEGDLIRLVMAENRPDRDTLVERDSPNNR
jgi:hypothetical protein